MRDNRQVQKYGALTKKEDKLVRERLKESAWQNSVERVYHGVDSMLLIVVILLVSMGAITLLSASYPYAVADGDDALSYFTKTIIFVAVGAAIIVFCCLYSKIVDILKKIALWLYFGTSALLVLVLFIGKNLNGARRSFTLGGISLQPSEIAKFVLIITLAWYFEKYKSRFDSKDKLVSNAFNAVIPLAILGFFGILILGEKHLSCLVIMTLVFLAVCLLSNIKWKVFLPWFSGIGVTAATVYLILNPYAVNRITTFADADADTLNEAWQTSQSLLAIGNGGLLGTGFGQSSLKFSYISEPMNDFIFAVYCEEMGFIGAVILVVLFGLLVWRGIKIALHAKDTFSQLTAFGISVHLGVQAICNLMVVTDLFPNTGISLPFFSYGGSALLMQMVEVGILLAISRHSYIKKKVRK